MAEYYSYRILLNASSIPSLFPEEFTKEEKFRKVFSVLMEEHKDSFEHYGSNNLIFSIKQLNENIFIWQLAKEQSFKKPIAGDDRVENVEDIRYPFIYLMFHVKRQIVLIEFNSTVFPDMDSVKGKIEKYFTRKIAMSGLNVNLNDVSDHKEFWSTISEMDVVNDVTLEFNPPNLWGGEKEVDRLVKGAHEETNFSKFKLVFQNKVEGLIFTAKNFGQQIARLASGGGEYVIKGLKDGVTFTIRSAARPFKKRIEDVNATTEEEAEDTFKEIDELNNEEE